MNSSSEFIDPDLENAGDDVTNTLRMDRDRFKVLSIKCSEANQIWRETEIDDSDADSSLIKEPSLEHKFGLQKGRTRYSNDEMIGEGANAKIYSLQDANCHRDVAVKLLKEKEYAEKTEEIRRFIIEAGIVASLEHPNIVPVYDLSCDEKGQVYLSMRKVRGDTLKAFIATREKGDEHPLLKTTSDLVDVFLKVCDALAYAHANGHVHQDVKSENIMCGQFGEVFLIDWGAAASGDSEVSLTPVYMSPAQANAEEPFPVDDVFCMGATMFHCFFGRFPTKGSSLKEIWEKRRRGVIDPLTLEERARVPAPLTAIILRAMARRPEDRYQTVDDLAQDLRNFQTGQSVSAYEYSLFEYMCETFKRHKAALLTAAAAIVLVGAAAGLLWARSAGERTARLRAQKQSLAEREARVREEKERTAEQEKRTALVQQRQESWIPLVAMDFTQGDILDPRFEPQHRDSWNWNPDRRVSGASRVRVRNGRLCVISGNRTSRTFVRWREPVSEELKLEVVLENTPDLNLDLGISGDSLYGYRFRAYRGVHSGMFLATQNRGYYETLSQADFTYDPDAKSYTITMWRSGKTIHVHVDGEEVLKYYDPIAPVGKRHRSFSVGRGGDNGKETLIRSIRVWRRRQPKTVDVLEVGRTMMRHGKEGAARRWFSQTARDHENIRIRQEAQFLIAFTYGEDDRDLRFSILKMIAKDRDNRFQEDATRSLVMEQLEEKNIRAAMETLKESAGVSLQKRIWPQVNAAYVQALRSAKNKEEYLRMLRGLPIDHLELYYVRLGKHEDALRGLRPRILNVAHSRLKTFEPLKDMPLEILDCSGSDTSDLSPLTCLPLVKLMAQHTGIKHLPAFQSNKLQFIDVSGNHIRDISPLINLPLETLVMPDNELSELTAVAKMRLMAFDCSRNQIGDLTPLANQQHLKRLICNENEIRSIAPLAELRLETLALTGNQLTAINALHGHPIHALDISNNVIVSLDGLQNSPLENLDCSGNPITDLSPIARSPLQSLNCRDTQVASILPLKGMSLYSLNLLNIQVPSSEFHLLKDMPLTNLSIDLESPEARQLVEALPNLEVINGFDADYVRHVLPRVQKALAAWRNGEKRCNPELSLKSLSLKTKSERKYMLVPIRLNWYDAEAFAQWQGGMQLTFTRSRFKYDFFESLTKEISGVYGFWLSLRPVHGKYLKWAGGNDMGWRGWPDRHHENQVAKEDRRVIQMVNAGSGWDDRDSAERHFFVIQWEK